MATRRPLVVVDGGAREIAAGDVLADDVQTVSAPAWAASTAYRGGDLVWQAGILYRRIAAGTSGATFDPAQWTLIGPTSGGSGASNPLDLIRPPVGGSYTEGHVQTNASAPAVGTLILGLLMLPPGTWDAVIARVNTPQTGATAKLAAYGIDATTGGLGSLLFETAAVSAASGGALVAPLPTPLVVSGGRLPMWVGAVNQGSAASSFWTATSAYGLPRLSPGTVDLGGTNAPASIQLTGVTGAAPNPPSGYSFVEYGYVIRVGFRRSA